LVEEIPHCRFRLIAGAALASHGTDGSPTPIRRNAAVRVWSRRNETILTGTARETEVGADRLESRWEVVILTGEATVAGTVSEDLAAGTESPGTLLWLGTFAVVTVVFHWYETGWTETALEAEPAAQRLLLGWEVVVLAREPAGRGTVTQNVVTTTSGVRALCLTLEL
jgi:hypothetical protein